MSNEHCDNKNLQDSITYEVVDIAGCEQIVFQEYVEGTDNIYRYVPVITKEAFLLAYNTWVKGENNDK